MSAISVIYDMTVPGSPRPARIVLALVTATAGDRDLTHLDPPGRSDPRSPRFPAARVGPLITRHLDAPGWVKPAGPARAMGETGTAFTTGACFEARAETYDATALVTGGRRAGAGKTRTSRDSAVSFNQVLIWGTDEREGVR